MTNKYIVNDVTQETSTSRFPGQLQFFEPDPWELKAGICNLTFLVASEPWPHQRKVLEVQNPPSPNFDGARAARVLHVLLLRSLEEGSTYFPVDSERLAIEAGFSNGSSAIGALQDLEKGGWILFTKGTPHRYEPGMSQPSQFGQPSYVELIMREPSGILDPAILPLPRLDLFSYDELWTPGWFLALRLSPLFEASDVIALRLRDLCELTGMTDSRVKRLLKKMDERGLCTKSGSTYSFVRSIFADMSWEGQYPARRYWSLLRNYQFEKNFSRGVGRGLAQTG